MNLGKRAELHQQAEEPRRHGHESDQVVRKHERGNACPDCKHHGKWKNAASEKDTKGDLSHSCRLPTTSLYEDSHPSVSKCLWSGIHGTVEHSIGIEDVYPAPSTIHTTGKRDVLQKHFLDRVMPPD
jgi:hypothetical protein